MSNASSSCFRFGLTAVMLAAGVLLWSSSAKAEVITINGTTSEPYTLLKYWCQPPQFYGNVLRRG